jgi:hypothetical protein
MILVNEIGQNFYASFEQALIQILNEFGIKCFLSSDRSVLLPSAHLQPHCECAHTTYIDVLSTVYVQEEQVAGLLSF